MLLRELFEAEEKTAAMAFGRMNPPTIGHEKLVNTIAAQKADPFLFITQSQKPKTDPLPFNIKLEFAKAAFPNVTVGDASVRTIIQALQKVESMGYTDLIYVAGSDRLEDFTELLNKYNGKDYTFKSIKVISAGERDPDAEGAEGMSASKMRSAAAEDNFEAFAQGLPKGLHDNAKNVFSAVRTGMGIKELDPSKGAAESTGDEKFDKMLKGITSKKAVAKQQKTDTRQQSRDAFGGMFGGGNPADKLSIRKKVEGSGELKIPTEDGITWQDIRLMAGEGKLTRKTVLQAIDIIRKQRKQQGVAEGLGDYEKKSFKRQELQHELGNEKNNIQVSINGKAWKVLPGKGYADSPEERSYLNGMKRWAEKKSAASGKTWEVSLTGAEPSKV